MSESLGCDPKTSDPTTMSLGDFYMGHDSDPLAVMPEFTRWRSDARDYHALMERRLATMVGTRTELAVGGTPHKVLNVASLDYLGLASHPEVIAAQQEALAQWGNGSAGVPLMSGMTSVHAQLQDELSAMTGKQDTLLFTSGFAAAIGLCIALLHRGDVAILDEKAHMSWMDGVRLSGAKLVTFSHNDPASLNEVLTRFNGSRRCVIIDGLYSMDGDFAPLTTLLDVADKHGVGIVVDEAHSVFADGEGGGGTTERQGEQQRVRVFMGTFSKALSMVGGFISADKALIDYLRYYSHPYVFSGALPPATVAGILKAVQLIRKDSVRRKKLIENASYMRQSLQRLGLDIGYSESWIIPIIFANRRDILFESVRQLMALGLYVAPVDYPAVPEDRVRIRIAVTAAHTREDLDEAILHIKNVVVEPMRAAGILGATRL